jgi:hypothetical protein
LDTVWRDTLARSATVVMVGRSLAMVAPTGTRRVSEI